MSIAKITVNPEQLKRMFVHAIKHGHQLLITGRPGSGKTAIFNQAVEIVKAEGIELEAVPEITSTADPTDYKGMPGVTKNGAEFFPIGVKKVILQSKGRLVVFLDDVGQAMFAVQAALMQMIHNQRAEHVTFIACTNDKADKAGVAGLIEPLKTRFHAIVNLETDVDSFSRYAIKSDFHEDIIAFIRLRPNFLYQEKFSLDLENGSNPRSLEHASDLLKAEYDEDLQYPLLAGACGQAFATEFTAFQKLKNEMPSPDLILLSPESAEVPSNPAVLYALSLALSRRANANNLDRLVTYLNRLPAEFNVLTMKDAQARDASIASTKAFICWASTNSDVLF